MEYPHDYETALLSLPGQIREELQDRLLEKAVIPSATVDRWLRQLGTEIGHLMIQLLPVAASYARAPLSSFSVGAVALGMPEQSGNIMGTGNLYLGANMEFPGQALSFCIHSEQSATNNAWLHGETGLQALAINAAPCGYCRQFLNELTTASRGFNILLKANPDPSDDSYTSEPLSYYLPDAFGPADMGIQGGLMQPEDHGLSVSGSDSASLAALAAANACYSPYTFDYSGISMVDSEGKIYTGRYAENAAYNPGMSPMASALAFMNMNSVVQTAVKLSRCILVESPCKISQKSATEAVLSSVAPGIPLEYIQTT